MTTEGVAWLFALTFLYFIPSLVAHKRKHKNTTGVFVLNIFLGWTFIGWVAALVMACWGAPRLPLDHGRMCYRQHSGSSSSSRKKRYRRIS